MPDLKTTHQHPGGVTGANTPGGDTEYRSLAENGDLWIRERRRWR